jgi:intracellular sulfur oxidation DsrE/DsrF family protein
MMVRYRVLFHLDEGSNFRLKLTLSNIQNLLNDLGDEQLQIECVVNGAGVKLFQHFIGSSHAAIETLTDRGIQFVVCEHSLALFELSKDDMLSAVGFVSSGVGELVKKQTEGWVYLKP